jgi:glycine cleavage system H protein
MRSGMEILGCVLPEDRLYDLENDTWWAPDGPDGSARVGLLAAMGAFAGPFRTFAFRPTEGVVGRGRSVATVESTRYTGAIRLPVDARVLERNERLVTNPRLLNDAPYSDGWVVRVRPERPEDPARFLEAASAIAPRLEERIRARRIRCWPTTPELELIEVGIECSAVLSKLNEELARRAPGEAILLVTDDPTSPIEMVRWSDQTGHSLLAQRREADLYQFLVRREAAPTPRVRRR